MAKYTAELNEIVQIVNGEIETIFDELLAEYPIFDPLYRDKLNKKIIKHYYFHEIGFETAERFVFEINRKMDELMDKYNQLYKSQIEINPFINFKKVSRVEEDLTDQENETNTVSMTDSENETIKAVVSDTENETLNTTGSRNDTLDNENDTSRAMNKGVKGLQETQNASTGLTQDKIKDVKSDTPTSQLLAADISGDLYASQVSVNDNTRNSNQSTTQNVSEDQTEETSETGTDKQKQTSTSDLTSDVVKENIKASENDTTRDKAKASSNESKKENAKSSSRNQYVNEEGLTISESDLLIRYRETFLNIDLDLIKELRSMFMMIL